MKVLHIEDDEVDAELLRMSAQDHEGLSISRASSGTSAITMLRSRRFDLVILDWSLPGAGGAEVLTAIRERPQWADVPVVVWTGYSDTRTIERAYALGANAVVHKDVDLAAVRDDLLGMLRFYKGARAVLA